MKLTLNIATFLVVVSLIVGCKEKASPEAKAAVADMIPKAVSITTGDAAFIASSATAVYGEGDLKAVADYAASVLHVSAATERSNKNQVYLSLVEDKELG